MTDTENRNAAPESQEDLLRAKTMEDIAAFIQSLHFRRKWFGGVDEMDVLKKMEQLQAQYRSAYEQQAARYQALLEEREEELARLKQA